MDLSGSVLWYQKMNQVDITVAGQKVPNAKTWGWTQSGISRCDKKMKMERAGVMTTGDQYPE